MKESGRIFSSIPKGDTSEAQTYCSILCFFFSFLNFPLFLCSNQQSFLLYFVLSFLALNENGDKILFSSVFLSSLFFFLFLFFFMLFFILFIFFYFMFWTRK